ncbi:MAG: IclR family transcriptional regulator [Alicyclobacillus herbarius]|uniref:IclR family transcriptional regulator n=1 Tax=Alicyclobacillus herbarius TaxID=122960 RepID=UPI0003F77B7C|nr:IclR family transcriptional regulator [Alicyclobacillus herbarius]MCL6632277.1 IclR family transcriptional regulator [Alicyclobacillus herbarius]
MNAEAKKQPQGIQSVEQAYHILKIISKSNKPLSMMELAQQCGMSKTRLHKYLVSLTRIGFLSKHRDFKYSLGNELILLGLVAAEQKDIRELAKPYIDELHATFNQTFALAIWGESGPFFILWQDSDRTVNIGIRAGSQVSLTHSAAGLIFSAFMDSEETQCLIDQEIQRHQLDPSVLQQRLVRVRKQGYASVDGELIPGIAAISVPVLNRLGLLEGALTVVGTQPDIQPKSDSRLLLALQDAAERLSKDLGFHAQLGG